MYYIRIIILTIFILLSTTSRAQIDAGKSATLASIVIDLKTGEVIEEHDADKLLTPASLTKLLTTAAVLEKMGAQSKIETRAYISIDKKHISIKGCCDPTIGSAYYTWHTPEAFATNIANTLKKNRITSIESIYFDANYIIGTNYSSKRLWEDMGNYYGAAPQAFNTNDNTTTYTFSSPAEPNKPCRIVSIDPNEDIDIINYVKSYTKQTDSVYIYGMGQHWYASGCMPCAKSAFKVKGAMCNPQNVFENKVMNELKRQGITIGRSINSQPDYNKYTLLSTFASPSIESIIKTTNHESVNLYADALMLHLCGEQSASIDGGLQYLRNYVEHHTQSKVMLYDGSGLSPLNAVSARQFATIIRHMELSAHATAYDNSLATAGISGTLKRLGKGSAIEGKVKGKSGSMTGVLSYAGIVTTNNGKKYIFCIIINHSEITNTELRKRITQWLSQVATK